MWKSTILESVELVDDPECGWYITPISEFRLWRCGYQFCHCHADYLTSRTTSDWKDSTNLFWIYVCVGGPTYYVGLSSSVIRVPTSVDPSSRMDHFFPSSHTCANPDRDNRLELIEYFQGFDGYYMYKPRLSSSLPAEVKQNILQIPTY